MKYDCIYRTYDCGEENCPCSLYTEKLVLTEEEERLFKYCEDFALYITISKISMLVHMSMITCIQPFIVRLKCVIKL